MCSDSPAMTAYASAAGCVIIKGMKKKIVAAMGLTAFVIAGLPYHIDAPHIVIRSLKIKRGLKLCVISDLHCRLFGKDQSRLAAVIDKNKPDLVLLAGDLFEVGRDPEKAFKLIDRLAGYTVFCVTGNHDRYLYDTIGQLINRLKDKGVFVIDDRTVLTEKNGEIIQISGVKDRSRHLPVIYKDPGALFAGDHFRLLLCHRPELTSYFQKTGADLVVCGHAHGGQWRLPHSNISVYAPGQGLFPKYTSGLYDLETTKLYVSRGLASGSPYLPRLFNNPAIDFIELKPLKDN